MKLFVLYYHEDNAEDGIKGVTDDEETAQTWLNANMEDRNYKEVELNQILCEECQNYWKIDKKPNAEDVSNTN